MTRNTKTNPEWMAVLATSTPTVLIIRHMEVTPDINGTVEKIQQGYSRMVFLQTRWSIVQPLWIRLALTCTNTKMNTHKTISQGWFQCTKPPSTQISHSGIISTPRQSVYTHRSGRDHNQNRQGKHELAGKPTRIRHWLGRHGKSKSVFPGLQT